MFHLVRAEHRLALALGEQTRKNRRGAERCRDAIAGPLLQGATRFFLGSSLLPAPCWSEYRTLLIQRTASSGDASIDHYAEMLVLPRPDPGVSGLHRSGTVADGRSVVGGPPARTCPYAGSRTPFVRIGWTRSPLAYGAPGGISGSIDRARFPLYLGWALAYRGRSLVASGQAQEGLALLTQGLAELRAIGAVCVCQCLLTWLAEAHAMLGQPAEALELPGRGGADYRDHRRADREAELRIGCRAIC